MHKLQGGRPANSPMPKIGRPRFISRPARRQTTRPSYPACAAAGHRSTIRHGGSSRMSRSSRRGTWSMILRAPGACSPTPQARQQQYRCATFDPGFLRISERLHQSGRRLCERNQLGPVAISHATSLRRLFLPKKPLRPSCELSLVADVLSSIAQFDAAPELPSLFGHIWQTQARSIMVVLIIGVGLRHS